MDKLFGLLVDVVDVLLSSSNSNSNSGADNIIDDLGSDEIGEFLRPMDLPGMKHSYITYTSKSKGKKMKCSNDGDGAQCVPFTKHEPGAKLYRKAQRHDKTSRRIRKELKRHKGYDLTDNNCQHFSKDVLNNAGNG
eukprot:799992_1